MRSLHSGFLHMTDLTGLTSLAIKADKYDLPYSGIDKYKALPGAVLAMKGLQKLMFDNFGICAFAENDFRVELASSISTLKDMRYKFEVLLLMCFKNNFVVGFWATMMLF